MKKNNKGFTLVELIVVLVILAILAAILVPSLLGYIDRARSEKNFSAAQAVREAAQAAIDAAYANNDPANNATANQGKITTRAAMKDTQGWWGGTSATGTSNIETNPYVKMVYDLSGLSKTELMQFRFRYSEGVITEGWVILKDNRIYVLSTNGTWSAAKSLPW